MDTNNFTAELFQEARHDKAAGTVHGIDRDLEMFRLDGIDIHERNLERTLDVDAVRIRGNFVLAHGAVVGIIKLVLVGKRKK